MPSKIRKYPIDWPAIFKQSGCTKGKLAYSDMTQSWAIFNGNRPDVHLVLVECPHGRAGDKVTLDGEPAVIEWVRIRNRQWTVKYQLEGWTRKMAKGKATVGTTKDTKSTKDGKKGKAKAKAVKA